MYHIVFVLLVPFCRSGIGAGKRRKEIASVLFKKLYAHKGASDLTTPLPPKKKVEWYVLLTRRNVRDVPAIPSKILG